MANASRISSWLASAVAGSCGATSDAGDCSAGSMGAWNLGPDEDRSWQVAAHSCLMRCLSCRRCRYITISLEARDCSWYHSCNLADVPPLPDGVPFAADSFKSGVALSRQARSHGRSNVCREQGECTCANLERTLSRLDADLRAAGFDVQGSDGQNEAGFEGSSSLAEAQFLCESVAFQAAEARWAATVWPNEKPLLHVCQTGFNRARSAAAFLSASPNVTLTSFDLGAHAYVDFSSGWIANAFGALRHRLVLGDSGKTLPAAVEENSLAQCDVVFIDGGHLFTQAFHDAQHFARVAKPATRVLMDDCPSMMGGAWSALCDQGVLRCEQSHLPGKLPRALWRARNTADEPKEICGGHFARAAMQAHAATRQELEPLPLEAARAIITDDLALRGVGVCRDVEKFSDCENGALGSWELPKRDNSLVECVARCLACSRCRYVSFSSLRRDCSWYSTCNLARLHTYPAWPAAMGTSYTTIRVSEASPSSSTNSTRASGKLRPVQALKDVKRPEWMDW